VADEKTLTPDPTSKAASEAARPSDVPKPVGDKSPPLNQPAPAAGVTPSGDSMGRLADVIEAAMSGRPSHGPLGGPAFATPGLSESKVPGGKYLIRGKLVNANNREIDEEGKILHPDQLVLDPFGKLI
jgi:hypothetical protein